ncbi:alanyl-tRNA synthetase [Leuconostoc citreum]|uniref:alanyl-tRNA synthetase n=1 Tax=Leuconostoc citreum TaxID=33964 RepID=UPI00200B7843|nr:alanyl-tRNA synthetase [Leuconostoc citreum]MCK8605642.1 alanyl-tRNA synthetase [Leuconostoc citreum]
MSDKKPNKTQILYLAIAGAGVIILVLLVLLLTGGFSNGNTGATAQETGTTAKPTASSFSSSSTKKYVEGKDYSIKYSNAGVVDKTKLDKAIKGMSMDDISSFIDTKTSSDIAKIEFIYNSSQDTFIIKTYHVGNDKPNAITRYSNKENAVVQGQVSPKEYDNQPVVYTWTNLTK